MQQIIPAHCFNLLRSAAASHAWAGALQQALAQHPWAVKHHDKQSTASKPSDLSRSYNSSSTLLQSSLSQQWQQQIPVSNPQQPVVLHHQQRQQQSRGFQQLRTFSAGNDVAKQRLVAAQQRRQREQEALQRRREGLTAADTSSAELQESSSTAVVPQESPPAEVQVARVFNHPALIVTRAIEWGTLILGFEQATKYTVLDQDGETVALIAEEISGIGNEIQRQVLRTRRSFKSTVLSADGSQILFRVRRPAYLINSYMYIEDPQGEVIGEVRQRWHLWRRKYDLFIGKRQFAAIDGGFLAWEFELKDAVGNTLALIDRNFLGFAKEIFTDAGKYVVHFGYKPDTAAAMAEKTLAIRSGKSDVHVTPLAQLRTEVAVIPSVTGNQLVVQQPLPLDERMIALAAAISVDYNFFSPHSRTSGLFSPPIFMPIPGGGGAPAGGAAAGAEGAAGGAAAGAAGAEAGTAAEAGGAAGAMETPGGFAEADTGFSSGFGSQGGSVGGGFGDDAESFKWDDVAGGMSGGGDEETSSGLWGMLVGLWAMIFGE